jgi:hypothetical protein
MDPYLEDEELWPSFQNKLVTCLKEVIRFGLMDYFDTRLGERSYKRDDKLSDTAKSGEECEPYLEIYDERQGRFLTLIDVVSPANKTTGPGRAAYLATR